MGNESSKKRGKGGEQEEEFIQERDQPLFVGMGNGLHGEISRWTSISIPKIPGVIRMFKSTFERVSLILNDSGEVYQVTHKGEITHLEFRASLSLGLGGYEGIIKISSGKAHFLALSISGRVFSFEDGSGEEEG